MTLMGAKVTRWVENFCKSRRIRSLILRAAVPYLRPATQYEFWVTGFTQKREGVSSPVLRTRTDTAKPAPPVITNTNCTGLLL